MTHSAARSIAEIFEEGSAIDQAMETSVREALRRHKQLGQSIVITRDGQVVWIPADEIEVPVETNNRSSKSNK